MVKTRVILLAASVILAGGCSAFIRSEKANPDMLQVARGRLGGEVSLAQAGGSLVAVYSDRETAGLYEVEIPVADRLPDQPPAAKLIDRIDVGPPLAGTFGQHVLASNGTTVTVFYLARAAEDKMILKLASHPVETQDWTLDTVEPAGTPLAVVPDQRGHLDLFWSAGSLLHVSYPGTGPVDSLASPFVPDGRAGAFFFTGADNVAQGVTAFDSASGKLFLLTGNGSTYNAVTVDGAGPVQSSLAVADGRAAVLTWIPSTRRVELLTLGQDASVRSRTTVTISAGTNEVQALPFPGISQTDQEPRADRLLFLYDDARRLGGGRWHYEISLLAPAGWGLAGRYRRVVLLTGADPIESFSALEAGGRLYVLVKQDGVKLLSWKLP